MSTRRVFSNGHRVEEWDDGTLTYRRFGSSPTERAYTKAEADAVPKPAVNVQVSIGAVADGELGIDLWPRTSPAPHRPVMFVHGYGSDASYCLGMTGGQCDLTVRVVNAGFLGFSGDNGGDSWGNSTALSRMTAAYERMMAVGGGPSARVALVTASMGAAVALNWAAANPGKVSCLVACIPVINLTDIVVNNRVGYAAAVNKAYAGGWSEAAYGSRHNPRTLASAGAFRGLPMLIYYGLTDELCIPEQTEAFGTAVGSAELVPMRSGHDYFSYANMDHERAVRFLVEHG